MSSTPAPRVVYDSMVHLQAVVRPDGPSFACLRLAENGAVQLLVSNATLEELTKLLARRSVRERFATLTDQIADRFLSRVRSFSEVLPDPPKAFALPRDPDDEILTDLAIAGNAAYLVSWNVRHLNYLMNQDTPEGREFCARHPRLRVLTPLEFLAEIAKRGTPS